MVFARLVAVLAVVSVAARGACGLSLEGVRPPHGASRPLPLAPHRRLGPRDSDLLPDDQALPLMSDAAPRYEEAQLGELDDPHTSYRLKHLISELAEAIAAAEALDGGAYGGPLPAELAEALAAAEGLESGDGRPLPSDVAEALAEAEAAAVMGGSVPGMWENRDRYMLYTDYVSRPGAEANNNNNNNNNRKARDSRNSRSVTNSNNNPSNNNNNNNSLTSTTTTSTGTSAGNNDNNMNHNSAMFKRAWPHNFSRRRNSGLSLSIDASMKVLREALYLEIARKKQRQQLQRAQHNKALLNTIGKRDVASQLAGAQHGTALGNDRN